MGCFSACRGTTEICGGVGDRGVDVICDSGAESIPSVELESTSVSILRLDDIGSWLEESKVLPTNVGDEDMVVICEAWLERGCDSVVEDIA